MSNTNMTMGALLKNPVHMLAYGFGAGLSPFAPGTCGSFIVLPVYYLLMPLNIYYYCALTAIVCIAGIWICHKTSKDLGIHDPGGIVWDEVAGMFITLTAVPADWLWLIVAFFVFRFFDVIKPWPINWLDKNVKGGLGIMVDDIVAGLFSLLVMHGLIYLF